jgi:hypothetical protein
MPDQKRHEDQQREQRTPGRDQNQGQQNFGNTQREPAQGARSDQDRRFEPGPARGPGR